jgi:hypothetical protein
MTAQLVDCPACAGVGEVVTGQDYWGNDDTERCRACVDGEVPSQRAQELIDDAPAWWRPSDRPGSWKPTPVPGRVTQAVDLIAFVLALTIAVTAFLGLVMVGRAGMCHLYAHRADGPSYCGATR